MTNSCGLEAAERTCFLFTLLEGEKFKADERRSRGWYGDFFQFAVFLLKHPAAESTEEEQVLLGLARRALIPFTNAPPQQLVPSQQAHVLISLPWGLQCPQIQSTTKKTIKNNRKHSKRILKPTKQCSVLELVAQKSSERCKYRRSYMRLKTFRIWNTIERN